MIPNYTFHRDFNVATNEAIDAIKMGYPPNLVRKDLNIGLTRLCWQYNGYSAQRIDWSDTPLCARLGAVDQQHLKGVLAMLDYYDQHAGATPPERQRAREGAQLAYWEVVDREKTAREAEELRRLAEEHERRIRAELQKKAHETAALIGTMRLPEVTIEAELALL